MRKATTTRREPRGGAVESALEAVGEVYRDLAARPVERRCELRTGCCHFRQTGRTPLLTRGEALLAARAVRAMGRKTLPERADGACPLLDDGGRCLIYEARPFGCRTHFCRAAGGPYARTEVLDLIRRLETADVHLGGDGPHRLEAAVAQALEMLTARRKVRQCAAR